MRLIKGIVTIGLMALTLSACSSLEQHASGLASKGDKAYLKAQSTQGLNVPPGLSSSKVGDDFSIPPVTGTGAVPASVVPPGGVSKQTPPGYKPSVAASGKNYFLKPIIK